MGSFFPQTGPDMLRHTGQLEVKYWSYEKGSDTKHGIKTSDTTEWSMILSGVVIAHVGDQELKLAGGDYILIHPGTPNDLVSQVVETVEAITVKAPSDPAAKHAVIGG
ncbi:cupin domain-containing protein [Gordonia sp. NPDC003422]